MEGTIRTALATGGIGEIACVARASTVAHLGSTLDDGLSASSRRRKSGDRRRTRRSIRLTSVNGRPIACLALRHIKNTRCRLGYMNMTHGAMPHTNERQASCCSTGTFL